MKVQVKHYCDMSQNERADYLEDKITARPDKIIPPGAKSYDYLVPIDESNGNPSTEGNTPGRCRGSQRFHRTASKTSPSST